MCLFSERTGGGIDGLPRWGSAMVVEESIYCPPLTSTGWGDPSARRVQSTEQCQSGRMGPAWDRDGLFTPASWVQIPPAPRCALPENDKRRPKPS